MIYKWFNWSPRYGIAHDLFHLIGIIVLTILFWPSHISDKTFISLIYAFSLMISVCFETIFAVLFLKIRGEEKHKIYFADNSEQWRFVNQLTTFAVCICYGLHIINAIFVFELSI